MNEANVVSVICEDLQDKNWQLWIDDHYIHRDLSYRKHSIFIGGARPDIYGLNDFNQIFAVEVKGKEDYKKAIGQALTYKSGVNHSYIGGLTSEIVKIKDIAISSGLGLICVDESIEKVKTILNPLYAIIPYYLEDIKNEINVLQSQKKESRSFSSFGRTHIINYFSPLYLFEQKEIMTKKELREVLSDFRWRNKSYTEFISGANTIGIIDLDPEGYKISNIGNFCLEYFQSLNINSLQELQELIDSTSQNNSVYSQFPHIAKFLQLIYFQNSDFKKFITILIGFNQKELNFRVILDKIIKDFPNLFLNLFVKKETKEKVIDIYLNQKKEQLIEDYINTIGEFMYYNSIFAFKRHLVHLGILSKESSSFSKSIKEYIIDDDTWILGNDILL